MTGLVIEHCWNGAEAVDKILECDDVQDSKNAGMNEHIAKPIDLKIISRALEKWLK